MSEKELGSTSYENCLKYWGDYFVASIGQQSLLFGNSENWELDGFYKEKIDRNPAGLWLISAEFLGETLGLNAFYIPKTDWQDRTSLLGVLMFANNQYLDFRLVPSYQVEGDQLWQSNFSLSYSNAQIENLIVAVDGLVYEHLGELEIVEVPASNQFYLQEKDAERRRVYAAVNGILKYTFPGNWTTTLSYLYNQGGMNGSEYADFRRKLDELATYAELLPAVYAEHSKFGLYRHYLGFFLERPLIFDKFDLYFGGRVNLYDLSWFSYGSVNYAINDGLRLKTVLTYADGRQTNSEFAHYFYDLDYSLQLSYIF